MTSCIPNNNLRPKLSSEFLGSSENMFSCFDGGLATSTVCCGQSPRAASARISCMENYVSFSASSDAVCCPKSPFFQVERSFPANKDLSGNIQRTLRSESSGLLHNNFSLPSQRSCLQHDGRWTSESLEGCSGIEDPKPSTPLASLKRKRPPLLSITSDICTHALVESSAVPVPFYGHSVDLTELAWDALEEISLEGETYAVESRRGKHEQLEDKHRIITNIGEDPSHAYFGLFDGHGGRGAAEYIAQNLHNNIFDELRDSGHRAEYASVLGRAFLATDANLLSEMPEEHSGAAAVALLLSQGSLSLAHCGDCRAVLSTAGEASQLTMDHHPDVEAERVRVEERGGKVVSWGRGSHRVQGVLAVSRAFGDRDLKQYITADPDVSSMRLTADHEFVVLGTDGLWDCVNNQEAVDLIRESLTVSSSVDSEHQCLESVDNPQVDSPSSTISMPSPYSSEDENSKHSRHNDENDETIMLEDYSDDIQYEEKDLENEMRGCISWMEAASRKLVDLALSRGSRDDITVIVVDLRPYQIVSNAPCITTPSKRFKMSSKSLL